MHFRVQMNITITFNFCKQAMLPCVRYIYVTRSMCVSIETKTGLSIGGDSTYAYPCPLSISIITMTCWGCQLTKTVQNGGSQNGGSHFTTFVGVSQKFLQAIQLLYKDVKCTVKINGHNSEWFNVSVGLK